MILRDRNHVSGRMKDPSKKTNPNGRRTLDIPMGKSNAAQTNRREQKRECEKIFQKEKEKNKRYKHGRENEAIEQHGIQPTPERER